MHLLIHPQRKYPTYTLKAWGAERRVLGARAPTKFSEEILQWVGTHKVLPEKVRGMEILSDVHSQGNLSNCNPPIQLFFI